MTTRNVTITGGTNLQKVAKLLEEGHSFGVKRNKQSLTFEFDEPVRPVQDR